MLAHLGALLGPCPCPVYTPKSCAGRVYIHKTENRVCIACSQASNGPGLAYLELGTDAVVDQLPALLGSTNCTSLVQKLISCTFP